MPLTLSPTSGTVLDGSTTLAITATWTEPETMAATVSGGGTISASIPTNGVPFTYTPPASGTGTATVSVGDSKALEASCVISYAPAPSPAKRAICAGNSLVVGQSLDSTAVPFPTTLATILGPGYEVLDTGIGGQTGAQILSGFTAQIGSHYDASKSNILILWEGTNDLYFGATASQASANLVAISQAWKAIDPSNKTYVLTVLPRGNFPGTSTIPGAPAAQVTAFETARQALNALIRGDATHFDKVVDVAADVRIGNFGANLHPAYYDGSSVHLDAAGYLLVAKRAAASILPGTLLAMASPSSEAFVIRPVDGGGEYAQVLSIQSGNAEQSFIPSRATTSGTLTLTFAGQTTAPISYTASDPGVVATPPGMFALFHSIPVTPGVAIDLSLTVQQNSSSFLARRVFCEVIEAGIVTATGAMNQDNIGAGDFTTPNDPTLGGAGTSSWKRIVAGYVPTTTVLSFRMSAPVTAVPQNQSNWIADALHVVAAGANPSGGTIYDDFDSAHFNAVGAVQVVTGGFSENYNGTFHRFPYGGGEGSTYVMDPVDAQAKLQALSTIGAGNVLVTAAGGGLRAEFVGALRASVQPDITSSSPAVAFARVAGGIVPTLHVTHADATTTTLACRDVWLPQIPGGSWSIYALDGTAFRFLPTDTATVTVPAGWMNTAYGPLAAGTFAVENRVGGTLLPAFDAGPKTMGVGQGVQQDVYYAECPAFVNFAVRSGLEHISPVTFKPILAWDSDGDPTLMATSSAFTIVTQPSPGAFDGVNGINPLNAPNGLWTVKWDGPTTGGSVGLGNNTTLAEVTEFRNLTGTVDNTLVYNIQANQAAQAAPWINWTWNASGPADVNGHFPCATKRLRIYPPDPSDPTGMTPWLNPTGKFHPSYLAKLANAHDVRFMQALDTVYNPYADFAQIKPASWLDRSRTNVIQRVQVAEVRQYAGSTALDTPSTLVLQIKTVQPHGLFSGALINLEFCGTANLSSAVAINGPAKSTLVLAEDPATGDLGAGMVDVIDATTLAFHAIHTRDASGAIVTGVTMTNVIVNTGVIRSDVGSSWAIEDAVDLVNELKAAYPDVPRCLWFNVPVTATDACIDAIAAKIAATLSPGIAVRAEFGNECWNFLYYTYVWMVIRNFQLFGFTDGSYGEAYAVGQINVNVKFQAAFDAASRGGDFVHVFATQSSDTANTGRILAKAAALSARVDEVAIAPYIGNYAPGDPFRLPIARYNLWSTGMHLDCMELNVDDPGFNYTAPNRAVIDRYYPAAKIVTYEGGPEGILVAWDGTPGHFSNVYPLQHSVHRHPRFFGIMLRVLQSFQDQGISLYTNFFLFGGAQPQAWSAWEWAFQQPGTGNWTVAPVENPDYTNTSALTAGGQVPVVSQVGGAIARWNSLVGAAASELAAGTATAGATTASTAAAAATAATGATGSVVMQWYRSTVFGQDGVPVAGQAGLALADSGLTASTTYYYKLKYTDAGGAGSSVFSNQVALTTAVVVVVAPPQSVGIDLLFADLVAG